MSTLTNLSTATGSYKSMSSTFRNDSKPPQTPLEIIERFFNRVARPVYLGTISVEIKYSLAQTQKMFDQLEDAGVIRPMTLKEKLAHDIPEVACIYVLTGEPKVSKAWY